MTEQTGQVDKRQVRASFNKAAASYDQVAVLQREVGERLLSRLDLIRLQPGSILDIGTGTGQIAHALVRRYRGSQVVALDIADAMLGRARDRSGWWRRPRFVCGDVEQLPLAGHSMDMILSNLTLQWCNSLERVFAEFRRVLKPGGVLFFTTFGPDTLKEVRQSWSKVDGYSHTNDFVDMHDIGDAMVRAGLAEPVMDMEMMQLTYRELPDLMREIKALGAHNVTAFRSRGLTGKTQWQAFARAYEELREAGVLPATYEVIYGHAWAPVQSRAESGSGEVHVPVDQLKAR